MNARNLAVLVLLSVAGVGDRVRQTPPHPATRWILAYPGTAKGGIGTSYTADDFVRLIGVVDSTGRVQSWLCTGVIFLQLYAPSGRVFTTWGGGTPATGADWAEYLDSIAGPHGALQRLDSAVTIVEGAAGKLGAKLPATLMIPYPEPNEDSVAFLGHWYSTRSAEGRAAAVGAYVRAATAQFERMRFAHVRLDGFYWLAENVGTRDTAAVIGAAKEVHRAHMRMLWIPYYFALGQDRWRHLGFDEGWLQPNYFFKVDVPPGRLDSAAIHAQHEDLGVEIEFNSKMFSDPRFAGRLDPYLDMLRAYPALRRRTIAIYDGQGALIRLSRSTAPEDRAQYARLVRALTARDER